jgi:uncharacterized protein YlzI (FlbEa/FlbD family)
MIWLTRVDGTPLVLNEDHVLYLECAGDTIVVLDSGERMRVSETPDELLERVRSWRLQVAAGWVPPGLDDG